MLHQLKSKVETEESRWKSRLDEREAELDRVRDEKDKLAQNNAAMEESFNVVNSAEEVWCKFNQFDDETHHERNSLHCNKKYNKYVHLLFWTRKK